MRTLHRSAAAEEIAAHNEGFVLGVASVLRLLVEAGERGWARYLHANTVIELGERDQIRLCDLIPLERIGLPQPRMAPSPDEQMARISKRTDPPRRQAR